MQVLVLHSLGPSQAAHLKQTKLTNPIFSNDESNLPDRSSEVLHNSYKNRCEIFMIIFTTLHQHCFKEIKRLQYYQAIRILAVWQAIVRTEAINLLISKRKRNVRSWHTQRVLQTRMVLCNKPAGNVTNSEERFIIEILIKNSMLSVDSLGSLQWSLHSATNNPEPRVSSSCLSDLRLRLFCDASLGHCLSGSPCYQRT